MRNKAQVRCKIFYDCCSVLSLREGLFSKAQHSFFSVATKVLRDFLRLSLRRRLMKRFLGTATALDIRSLFCKVDTVFCPMV